jgi:hypothetical protein
MNYPFLYKILDTLSINEIKKNLVYTEEKINVWDTWQLRKVESPLFRQFLSEKMPHLKIFQDTIYISEGTESNFHIDRYRAYHLLHRVLMPLNQNFSYQWIQNEKVVSYEPKAGEVLLFNNMLPHRFVSNGGEFREVIYLDLFDPLTEDLLGSTKGNYSEQNVIIEKKYKNI